MLTPARKSPDERGQRWLQAQVQQILAAHAVALATPDPAEPPACAWGTGPETSTTLYLRLAGDPEPKALPFRHVMITDCGAGLYVAQHNALRVIRRALKKMGLLSA
jgi:hypothetical protein